MIPSSQLRIDAPRAFGFESVRRRDDPRIQQLAIKTLTELALSLTVVLFVSFYVAPIEIPSLLTYLLVQSIVNSCLRWIEHSNAIEKNGHFLEWKRAAVFAQLTGHDAQTLIHEIGHAGSSYLVYQKPTPQIRIVPLSGGSTQYCPERLTRFGNSLGPERSKSFVTVAGPSLTLLVSTILLWIGLKIRKTRSEEGAYLISYALNDFSLHAIYALSGLWSSAAKGHDFARLASLTGQSPLAMTIGIIAVPAFILLTERFSSLLSPQHA